MPDEYGAIIPHAAGFHLLVGLESVHKHRQECNQMRNIKTLVPRTLSEMIEACRPLTVQGKTASYIPGLQSADPAKLGICVADSTGRVLHAGDSQDIFTIQSIVKVLTFTASLLDSGIDKVSHKVSVEPTDDGFNSIVALETKNENKPLNPMINAGSIACITMINADTLFGCSERILELTRRLSGNESICVDEDIYNSEKSTGSRNRAIAYFMKSTGIIEEDVNVEELLDAYFRVCSFRVTCADLANIALVYAGNGTHPITGEEFFPSNIARVIKATMVMCGMYEESGRVAVRIGLPTKSGVGGGIMSIIPGQMGIGIYGPALNEKGSSIAGLALLKKLSNFMDASIF